MKWDGKLPFMHCYPGHCPHSGRVPVTVLYLKRQETQRACFSLAVPCVSHLISPLFFQTAETTDICIALGNVNVDTAVHWLGLCLNVKNHILFGQRKQKMKKKKPFPPTVKTKLFVRLIKKILINLNILFHLQRLGNKLVRQLCLPEFGREIWTLFDSFEWLPLFEVDRKMVEVALVLSCESVSRIFMKLLL